MVVGRRENEQALDPQLNYLHLCIAGAFKLYGVEGFTNFLDTTHTFNGTIREYLKNVDLISWMARHDYSPR